MRETTLKIALAGLMHDIGKFAQGCLPVTKEYLQSNAGQYQPFRDGHHTHVHAVYTAAFIEQMAKNLPTVCNSGAWGEGDSFINLAAGHHRPETPMQWVITKADWISSGLDRATFETGKKIAYQDFRKTRLLPILEMLGPERCDEFESPEKFQYEYPLSPVSAASIFAIKRNGTSKSQAEKQYQKLFDSFIDSLGKLHHKDIDLNLWVQHFDSLLMLYTSAIPAARVGDVVHDVSLYDHLRTTAAIAAALYQYHKGKKTLEQKAILNHVEDKFLLIGGDFFGIQNFIFSMHGDTRKYRSKLLRGRSFTVSLFTELAARFICEELNLPSLSVLMNAAGKFHILAPNLEETRQAIDRVRTQINDWLFKQTYGLSSLGITWTKASPANFDIGSFRTLWDDHLRNMEGSKYFKIDMEKYGGVVQGFLDSFNHDLESEKRLCPLCGIRPACFETKYDPIFKQDNLASCAFCRDHVFIGGNLVKGEKVAVCSGNASFSPNKKLLAPIFDRYQVIFPDGSANEFAAKGELLSLWRIGIEKDGTVPAGETIKLINGHVPFFREQDNYDGCLLDSAKKEEKLDEMLSQIREGSIKTFSHIAIKARHKDDPNDKYCRGIEALGVLKADVDNLGMLFGCGLPKERFTISRLATVSRQLNNFFSLYLPNLLASKEEFFDVYTVFAGGDDLFLIGPWNKMADLALFLNRKFNEFVCNNPQITFSAGITVHKPNTPVDVLAEASEKALTESKRKGRNRVTMFQKTVGWGAFGKLMDMRKEMEGWLSNKFISDVMFYRFNYLVNMAEEEAGLAKQKTISMDALACVKWPALFQYSLARNVTKDKDKKKEAMEKVGKASEWIKVYRGAMRMPLWHVLYEKRQ